MELLVSYPNKRITDKIPGKGKVCEKCNIALETSNYKNIRCFISTSRNDFRNNYCIPCALIKKIKISAMRYSVTIEDLEKFLEINKLETNQMVI